MKPLYSQKIFRLTGMFNMKQRNEKIHIEQEKSKDKVKRR